MFHIESLRQEGACTYIRFGLNDMYLIASYTKEVFSVENAKKRCDLSI